MPRSGRHPQHCSRPRPSKHLRRLQVGLGLDPEDWDAFLWHVRNGFADFERANWPEYGEPLDLPDVPPEWFSDAEALGYVTIRVLRDGKAALALPVALYFLSIGDPGPNVIAVPPGLGLAWLQVATVGATPPIAPARLAFLAAQSPKQFFQGVAEDALPALSRLILEAKGPPEAWDLHVLFAVVERANIHVRAPFRLFESLMAAEWLSARIGTVPVNGYLLAYRLGSFRKALAVSLPHDILARAWQEELPLGAAIWKLADDFGRSEARFVPYYDRECPVRGLPKDWIASAYGHPSRGALVSMLIYWWCP